MNPVIIGVSKFISLVAKTFNLGAGSTWPGHVALGANPDFIHQVLSKNRHIKVILIAGTNGKTTTTKLLRFILERNGLHILQNEAGANLLNGVASTLVKYATVSGKLVYDVAIFEIDENTLPLALEQIPHPYAILLLNLFRDQLDRYGEVNTIALKWQKALLILNERKRLDSHSPLLFVNGDDPELTYISLSSKLKSEFFGVDENYMNKRKTPHDVDFLYCPNCHTKLTYEKISYSHMGKFKCSGCGYRREKVHAFKDLPNPLFGTYNVYNLNAAALVAKEAFNVPVASIKTQLAEFKPAFGRQEVTTYNGKRVIILLSKNPTGFNQSINAVNNLKGKRAVLLVLNDRIPDGRDVSWIWDVDFEDLAAKRIIVSGDRAFDMAIRMKYTQETKDFNSKVKIVENLEAAIHLATEETHKDETLFILPTYSAMLEVRKIIGGRKIL